MKVLIIEAPEVKIFQPLFQKALMEDPSQIYKANREEIVINRACGAIRFQIGVPKIFGGPIGSEKEQVPMAIINFLEEDQESDCYGVASLKISDETFSAFVEQVFSGMVNPENLKKVNMPENLKKELIAAKARAKQISREKVYRVIRRNVTLLDAQYKRNKEGNLGTYEPSPSEWLCKYALREELKNNADKRAKLIQDIEAPMSEGLSKELGE